MDVGVIAIIRLLPKIHKLSCKPGPHNFSLIPSRIVRGGESCPMNPYSLVLQKLLATTISDLENNFKIISKSNYRFPLINGCEKFEPFINNLTINNDSFFKTILLTSDFKDAFVNATLEQLVSAIETASIWLKYSKSRMYLMIKLAKMIFPNCTFSVPKGIILSKDGYPIGGHSSCEALNLNLLVCEIKALFYLGNEASGLKSVCRLVDDVSFIFNGDFDEIFKILKCYISFYPPCF